MTPLGTRASTLCRRPECRQRFDQHLDGQCPALEHGLLFQTIKKRVAASQSFSEAEVEALDEIVRGLLNSDVNMALRVLRSSKAGIAIMQKIYVMKKSIAKQKTA